MQVELYTDHYILWPCFIYRWEELGSWRPETWYDRANEEMDGALWRIYGTPSKQNNPSCPIIGNDTTSTKYKDEKHVCACYL